MRTIYELWKPIRILNYKDWLTFLYNRILNKKSNCRHINKRAFIKYEKILKNIPLY